MTEYRVVPGSFSVEPTKSAFAADEDVGLRIRCTVQRRNGVSAWLAWTSVYRVYNRGGELLAEVSREHSAAPWTDIDTAEEDFIMKLGTFTPGTLAVTVKVSAHG